MLFIYTALSSTEPALYHALTSVLSEDQKKQLSAVFVLADQRKAQMDSRRIEQSGGNNHFIIYLMYKFNKSTHSHKGTLN